jgi:hypothetical protein
MTVVEQIRLIDSRHPDVLKDSLYWNIWRQTFAGGSDYIIQYLKKFTERETDADFNDRMAITPSPSFAKAAVLDLRNGIFQRMHDIIRVGGSPTYQRAVAGESGGVDQKGSTMTGFMGIDILTELLVMGKVGVYVDMPQLKGPTLADVGDSHPYLYLYQVEDILSWTIAKPDDPLEYQAILLRDIGIDYSAQDYFDIDMPVGTYERYRLVYIDKNTGFVNLKFFDMDSNPINQDGYPSDGTPITLALRKIPFVLLDIGDSILKDVANHQAALLNLGSSDVAYALKANFPFYTEQQDIRAVGDHLKHTANPDGTAMAGGQRSSEKEVTVGASHGRIYDLKAERPGFIHPSPDPLRASMELQDRLEDGIRKLVNLAVTNKIGNRARSAESMKMSDQGLEAGLSFIGLVLESAERRVANYWAAYEEKNEKKRQIATIQYPTRYSLKTDSDRILEATKLSQLMFTVPGQQVKKEIAKNIVTTLLGGKIKVDTLDKIFNEIDNANYSTSDPNVIIQAKDAGLVGDQLASLALGFSEEEYLQAQQDHAARAVRILNAQQSGKAAARGVSDLAPNQQGGQAERQIATDTTLNNTTQKPVRGKGK